MSDFDEWNREITGEEPPLSDQERIARRKKLGELLAQYDDSSPLPHEVTSILDFTDEKIRRMRDAMHNLFGTAHVDDGQQVVDQNLLENLGGPVAGRATEGLMEDLGIDDIGDMPWSQ